MDTENCWKTEWLQQVSNRFPVGAQVRVVRSDVEEYIGTTGVVVDYDIGVDGEWPLVGVVFDTPVGGVTRDGFYGDGYSDDEIVFAQTV